MLEGRLGLGLDLSVHSPSRLDTERAWDTLGAAGVLWVSPIDRLTIGGLIGGHRLRFTESSTTADAVERAFIAADLSTPIGPIHLYSRLTTDLAPVTLYGVDQLGREEVIAELGTLWSGQVGVRWWPGR